MILNPQSWRRKWATGAGLVIIGCAAMLTGGAAHAEPLVCTLAGGEPGTEVRQADKALKLPVHLPDCTGATVVKGAAVACIQGRLDSLRCRKVLLHETITAETFGPGVVPVEWRKSLADLLSGGFGTADAKSRSAGSGLPTGRVLMAFASFDIDFTQATLVGVQAIEFRQSTPQGPLVLRVPAVGVRTVDATLFVPGGSYSWTLLPAGNLAPFHGRFVVADTLSRRKAERQADKAVGAQPDPQIQSVLRADSFYRDGYAFDAAQALRQGF